MHFGIKNTLKTNCNHISKQACSAPIMNILKKQIFDIITNTLIKKKIEWFSLLYIVHVDTNPINLVDLFLRLSWSFTTIFGVFFSHEVYLIYILVSSIIVQRGPKLKRERIEEKLATVVMSVRFLKKKDVKEVILINMYS